MRRALFLLVGFLIVVGLYLSGCTASLSLPTRGGPAAPSSAGVSQPAAQPAESVANVAPESSAESGGPDANAATAPSESASSQPAAPATDGGQTASSASASAPGSEAAPPQSAQSTSASASANDKGSASVAQSAPSTSSASDKGSGSAAQNNASSTSSSASASDKGDAPAAQNNAPSAASAAAPPAGSKTAANAAKPNTAPGGKSAGAAAPVSAPANSAAAPAAPASAAPAAAASDAAAPTSDGAPSEDAILKTVTVAPNAAPAPISVADLPGNDVTNILILGSDRRYKTDPGRTDVILLATIDKVHDNIHLLSIPRDLWVYIPGVGYNRVNTAYLFGQLYKLPGGGIGTLKATLMHNLGLRVDRFVVADFNGFTKVVDDFGGVDVDVPCGLYDRDWVRLSAGRHHLNGEMALRYARTRYSTNDFSRAARQQQVLRALWEQTPKSELILKIPQLWSTYKDSVDTDLNLGELLALGQFLGKLHSEDIKTRVLTYPYVSGFTTSEGAQVLQLDQGGYRKMIADFYKGTPGASPVGTQVSADGADVGRVVIWNGTNRPNLAELAAEALRNQGGLPVAGTGIAYTTDYPKTVILNYGAPPETISTLTKFFGVVPVQLVRQGASDMPDAVVVLGADYQTCHK